jgi:tRNA 5-methylaminomethyl-2-thiouridine biosynthesis bifunctional protein
VQALDLSGRAGQLSLAKVNEALPETPVSGAGYGARFGDRLAFGATYERWSLTGQPPPPVTDANHAHNRDVLAKIAPQLAACIDLSTASGRCSIRVVTPDQIPIAGPAQGNAPNLYVLAALGSRGFTTAFLCAEVIASQACGEPSPVEHDVTLALAPDRFAKRRQKRDPKNLV